MISGAKGSCEAGLYSHGSDIRTHDQWRSHKGPHTKVTLPKSADAFLEKGETTDVLYSSSVIPPLPTSNMSMSFQAPRNL